MADLYCGMLVLACASAICFAITVRVCRGFHPLFCDAGAGLVIIAAGVYALAAWQAVTLANMLPFSNLVVLSNWFPILAALLLGFAWRRLPGRWYRRSFFAATLMGTAWFAVTWPLLGEPPSCGSPIERDGFCMQTTDQTCSPVCAANLLRLCGIASSEQEMAELCLTREGTTWQGLYRGLKLKTANTDWDVRVVHGDADQLLANASGPMILSVGLERDAKVDGVYQLEFGWRPGGRHSVIFLPGRSARSLDVVDPDPDIGRERWSREDLHLLYRGPALQLTHR